MKQLALLATVLLLIFSATQAQIKREQPTQKRTVAPPPPAPTNKTTTVPATATTPVYTLTAVRVNVRTGADNKEFPSGVYVTLSARSDRKRWRNYIQQRLTNEMKINSNTEFGLDVVDGTIELATFQQSGLLLSINYAPNIIFDAWKIESVSAVLEFKDQNGNLHPTFGSKTIVFSNATGFLNNEFRYMNCFTDASLTPMTAVVSKNYAQ
jgi:hypothetical protein